jgi:hypothetical protein
MRIILGGLTEILDYEAVVRRGMADLRWSPTLAKNRHQSVGTETRSLQGTHSAGADDAPAPRGTPTGCREVEVQRWLWFGWRRSVFSRLPTQAGVCGARHLYRPELHDRAGPSPRFTAAGEHLVGRARSTQPILGCPVQFVAIWWYASLIWGEQRGWAWGPVWPARPRDRRVLWGNLLPPSETTPTISVGKTEFDSIQREGEEVSGQPGPLARRKHQRSGWWSQRPQDPPVSWANACGRAGWAGMVMRLARQERPTVSFPLSFFIFFFYSLFHSTLNSNLFQIWVQV